MCIVEEERRQRFWRAAAADVQTHTHSRQLKVSKNTINFNWTKVHHPQTGPPRFVAKKQI